MPSSPPARSAAGSSGSRPRRTRRSPRSTGRTPSSRVMEHVAYCIELVGVDHVALGPDTLFGDHVALHHAFAAQLSIKSAHGQQPFDEVEFVDGIENPSG